MKWSKILRRAFYFLAAIICLGLLVVLLNLVDYKHNYKEQGNKEDSLSTLIKIPQHLYPGECPWSVSGGVQYIFREGIYFIDNFCVNKDKTESRNEFYLYSVRDGFTKLYEFSNPTWISYDASYQYGQLLFLSYDLTDVLDDSKLVLSKLITTVSSPNARDKDRGCPKTPNEAYILDPDHLDKGIYLSALPTYFLERKREENIQCQLDRFGEIRY